MTPTPPDRAQPAVAAFDPSHFGLLPVPVAWCNADGHWLGNNSAFGQFTGLNAPAEPGAAAALPGGLVDAHGSTSPAGAAAPQLLRQRLQHGAPVDGLAWRGQAADGQWRSASFSLRCHGPWRVVTLLPAAAAGATPGEAGTALAAAPVASEQQTLLQRLDTAQRLARFGTWTHDLRSHACHWDAQVCRFLGRAPQAQVPLVDEVLAALHPDDRAEARAVYAASLRQAGHYSQRLRLLRAEGGVQHVRAMWQVADGTDGAPAQATGVVLDDTETFHLAQSASDAQSQLNLVLALADIAIWEHEAATGLLRTSTLGWALLGLPPQPQGLPLLQVADQLDSSSRAALLARTGGQPGLDIDLAGAHGDGQGRGSGQGDLALRCRRPDGRWRVLLTRRVRQHDAQGRLLGHVGVVLDLSERFDAQQQALALAQRLELATAAAGVGVWSAQLGQPMRSHWDTQMRRLHGMPPDAPAPELAAYLREQVHEADRAAVNDNLQVLMQRDEGLLDIDMRIVWPDGQVRRMATRTSVRNGPDGRQLHGVMLDVTERHATEERLRQATERAALAARGAGIGTWESNHEALAGWWDAQMFRLRGLDRAPGMVDTAEMRQWLHPADRDGYARQMAAALREDAPTNAEFRVVWPDGTVRWLASRSSPVRDESGRTVRRIGINWDITDARNAEAARQERLLAQRESQARARFLARISHELRTPLNAVLGFSQLLLAETADDQAPDPATWRSRVTQVHASGEHLLALIDDVLELSSLESGELPLSLQPVALAPLARTSLPLVELLARQHGVELLLDVPDAWVLADPVRLRQVLLNLLSNAIKYNRRGGRVVVGAAVSGGWWLLRVEDTGRGMSPAQLQHLFEPFNRLGAEREGIAGTGIGLAIVQASMQHMGGAVQVRSTPGEGSVFELALQQSVAPQPAAAGFAPGAPMPGAPAALADAGTGAHAAPQVLYIEDNEVNMLIVRELVGQRAGLRFEGAVDGRSGLAAAHRLQPDLILLDMQLPDTDGHAVLRALRADPSTAQIRCIALSANAMPEDIRAALAEGFDDYWTKPLDLVAFQRALDRLFGPATV